MPGHDIVVIGASAGGIEALTRLAKDLPADLPAAVFVVLHVSADSPGVLPSILGRAGPLPVASAVDGARIEPGHIWVAPPDRHLLLTAQHMRVVRGPRENRHRPAVDPLFRSAAAAFGSRTIGVVLTGNLDDGTSGLWAIKAGGGIAVVQDPADALYPGMPESALRNVEIDHRVKLAEIAPLLAKLAREPAAAGTPPARAGLETEFTMMEGTIDDMAKLGQPSSFTCPTCNGPLWELRDGNFPRYRCHTGHAFSPESLRAAQGDEVENALYAALRAMQEQAALSRRVTERIGEQLPQVRATRDAKVRELEASTDVLRRMLAERTASSK
jgi:two-component system chemotaxis response regulator CheB